MNVQRDEEDEKYLRYLLLWAYHKQLEDGTILREALNEDLDYLENVDALLHLLEEDSNEEDDKLFRAELHRFAGRFDRSLELLEPTLNDPLWGVISKKMKELSEAGNREVFVLDVP
jgi:tetratricopeptide (TPR) repeat protein